MQDAGLYLRGFIEYDSPNVTKSFSSVACGPGNYASITLFRGKSLSILDPAALLQAPI